MHILLLTPQLPYPPRQGTSIRNYHLLAHLAQRHTVDLLTFLAPGEALLPNSPLHRLCRRVAVVPQPQRTLAQRLNTTFFFPRPDMAWRLASPAMQRLVAEWTGQEAYDIVQVEGIELVQYGEQVRRTKMVAPPWIVFDNHNCEYLLQKRNALMDLAQPRRWHAAGYSLVQWAKLRRYEAAACERADAVVAVSQPDQAALQAIAPGAHIALVPNGIDPKFYSEPIRADQPSDSPTAAIEFSPNHKPFTLLFSGKMDYRPNIDAALWFGQEVLPKLYSALNQAGQPQIRWQIVGQSPHSRLDILRDQPGIELVGAVPDIRPYLAAADAYIIPMRVGGGTRFKALEAMAARKPIVSTPLGVEGLGISVGQQMLLAATPEDFAARILDLVKDQAAGGTLAKQLGDAAFQFVTAHYDWAKIIPHLDQLYSSLQPRALYTSRQQGVLL